MGGKAFSSGLRALFTPRLAREVYEHAQQQCFAALKPLFPLVKSPVEAPEKTTFGDIDVLACLEGSSFTADEIGDPKKAAVWEAVAKELRPARTFQESTLVKNFALPWPALTGEMMARQLAVEAAVGDEAVRCGDKAVASGGEAEKEAEQKPRYIQVDIHLCATNRELEWSYFKYAHGDLRNILNAIIRPNGLIIGESALYVRIPEIEHRDKKKARVFLTDKPTEVLDFLGLPHENGECELPFASFEELFEYAARCRWQILWPRKDEDDHNAKEGAALDGGKAAARRNLNHNDRQRMRQRPIFARWFDEFVPACQATGRFIATDSRSEAAVRDEVRAAAFRAFPGAETAYDSQLAAWRAEQARIFVKNTLIKTDACLPGPKSIARVLPAPKKGGGGAQDIEKGWRGALRSALVRIVVKEDFSGFEGVFAPPMLRDKWGVLLVDEVEKWITENWEAVGREAWRENGIRAAEAYRIREGRKKERAAGDEASAKAVGTGQAEDDNAGGSAAA